MCERFVIRFEPTATIKAVMATDPSRLPQYLVALGLLTPRPVLVLVGGADGLDSRIGDALTHLFTGLVDDLDARDIAVIDGGTDAGVMARMGLARDRREAHFPLIGIAARGTVHWPGVPARPGTAALEPHHSHLLLVPGERWGDESAWIRDGATVLAAGAPTLTLAAGGGRITDQDIALSIAAGRRTLLLADTGGATDHWARNPRHQGFADGLLEVLTLSAALASPARVLAGLDRA